MTPALEPAPRYRPGRHRFYATPNLCRGNEIPTVHAYVPPFRIKNVHPDTYEPDPEKWLMKYSILLTDGGELREYRHNTIQVGPQVLSCFAP